MALHHAQQHRGYNLLSDSAEIPSLVCMPCNALTHGCQCQLCKHSQYISYTLSTLAQDLPLPPRRQPHLLISSSGSGKHSSLVQHRFTLVQGQNPGQNPFAPALSGPSRGNRSSRERLALYLVPSTVLYYCVASWKKVGSAGVAVVKTPARARSHAHAVACSL